MNHARSRQPRARSYPRARAAAFLALGVMGLALSACTGTTETRTPVAILVAGNTATQGVLDVYASGLPEDPNDPQDVLTLLPTFRQTLAGEVIAVATPAEESATRRYVLHRTDRDLLTVFDTAAVDLADPSSLGPVGTAIDLGARVVAAGVLDEIAAPSDLCTTAMAVSSDGAWLGVIHDLSACSSASSVPAALLIELAPSAGTVARVLPTNPSTNDTDLAPSMRDTTSGEQFVWMSVSIDPQLRTLNLSSLSATPGTLASYPDGFLLPTAFATPSYGVVYTDGDRVAFIDPNAAEPSFSETWERPSTLTSLSALRTVRGVPGAPILLLSSNGIGFVASLTGGTEENPVSVGRTSGLIDAVVDPYGYAFVVNATRGTAFDLLGELTNPDANLRSEGSVNLASGMTPVATTWAFVSDTREDVAATFLGR